MTVLIDPRVSEACERTLVSLDVTVKRLPLSSDLEGPVAGHPDLLATKLPQGELLLTRRYYEANRAFFDSLGHSIRLTDEALGPQYPRDVLFDALVVGDTLYGKDGTVSQVLRQEYRRFVPVNQGYARCSVALLSDRAAMTADRGLAEALRRDGVAVLDIRPGHIALPGYNHGFIGGAGGRLNEDSYVFFGNLASHPDGDAILRFAERQKISAVSLSDEPMCDHGGIVCL
jgi:hypothetical protein